MVSNSPLPTGSKERKDVPLVRGLLDYFPAALAEVARVSKAGNDKHNPGEEMHHARGKSMDHADCILRHLVDRGKIDEDDGQRHSAKVAWRALALLQEELEADGAPLARAAKVPTTEAAGRQPPEWIDNSLHRGSHDVPGVVMGGAAQGLTYELRFRNGSTVAVSNTGAASDPRRLRWSVIGSGGDIVAYRVWPR